MITFTEQAKSRAMAFMEGQGNQYGIRICVKQNGCHLNYSMDWENTKLPGDAVIVQDDLTLYMDADSFRLLTDAVVDFMERDEQEGFIIRHHTSPCSLCKEATPNCH